MKKCTKCGEMKPLEEYYNKPTYMGKTAACKACEAARSKQYREKNSVAYRAQKKEYCEKNRGGIIIRRKQWYSENTERAAVKRKEYYDKNPEIVISRSRNREQNIKQNTPVWADRAAMRLIYLDAAEFRKAGVDVHVDHVIPLRAKLASGLHNEFNLTIKLASWNDSKGNKYDPMKEIL